MKVIISLVAATLGISLGVVLVVMVVGGGPVSEESARTKTEQSRRMVDADFADAESVIAMRGAVSRSWGTCMSSPTDAVEYSVSASIDGDPDALFEQIGVLLESAGWTAGEEDNTGGLRGVVLTMDELTLDVGTDERGAYWGLTGECIRVPSDLAEDLLAE